MWFLVLLALAVAASAEIPPGWRVEDRYAGFRFELTGQFDRIAMIRSVRNRAEELLGFGWVQHSRVDSVVGEFRGTPHTAAAMEAFLQAPVYLPDEEGAEVELSQMEATLAAGQALTSNGPEASYDVALKRYEDTKITLHFTHFKVLHPARLTCFAHDDGPHACRTPEERAMFQDLTHTPGEQ